MKKRRDIHTKRISWMINWLIIMVSLLTGCKQPMSKGVCPFDKAFWGDSTSFYIFAKPQNGYKISIAHNANITMLHFERGDSFSCYCAIDLLPESIRQSAIKEDGIFIVDVDIPVVKVDTLDNKHIPKSDIFFMDVNFDGKGDFVQAIRGNGWIGYTCYDLENGIYESLSPGIVPAMKDAPYDSFSSGIEPMQSGYVAFDYQKKEIFIHHGSGCCAFTDTWAKAFEGDSVGTSPCIKVVKEECYTFDGDTEVVETYALRDDTLKMVGITKRKYY